MKSLYRRTGRCPLNVSPFAANTAAHPSRVPIRLASALTRFTSAIRSRDGCSCALGQIGQNAPKDKPRALNLNLRAKDRKYGSAGLIDLAGARPRAVPEQVRPVVVAMTVEEYERLTVLEMGQVDSRPSTCGTAE